MTPVKDTLATLTSAAEAIETGSSKPATSKPESGGLRSDAVSLEVPVNVHGSRVVEIVRETTSHSEPFEERTATMIVFPQGAVLRMATPLNAGQMVVVTNLKSGQDAICRVVKVRAYAPSQSYVEVEFTHRQVGYWGVQFSSDPFEPKKSATQIPAPFIAPIAAPVRIEPALKERAVTEMPRPQMPPASENAHELGAQIAKSISAFAQIGSQEDVHPSAMPSVAPAVAVMPSVSGGDAFPAPDVVSQTALQTPSNEGANLGAPTLGRFASVSTLAGDTEPETATPASGYDRESENSERSDSGNKKLILIAAGALAVVAAVGGYLFFAHQPASNAALVVGAPSAPVISSSMTESVTPSATAKSPAAAGSTPGQASNSGNTSAIADARAQREAASRPGAPARHSEPESAPVETAEPHTPSQVPSLFGAMNAHPVAPHGSGAQAQSAPDVDVPVAAAQAANVLPAMAPQANLEAPVHTSVGPRLISAVAPDYPALARQMGVQGNVVISATVQPNGTLGNMKVISGSPLLRQSALNALQHWKYVPGQDDGQPTATPITVTVHFDKK